MKKLLLLLILPTTLLSQTFNELKMVNSLDGFIKVMIENKYEFNNVEDNGNVSYGFNLVKDEENGNKSEKWGSYNEDGSWSIQFSKTLNILYNYGDYDRIVRDIKDKCSYVDIVDGLYVSYSCEESEFDGKIGFMISDSNGYISYFPNKE